jgi:hypothetical protein
MYLMVPMHILLFLLNPTFFCLIFRFFLSQKNFESFLPGHTKIAHTSILICTNVHTSHAINHHAYWTVLDEANKIANCCVIIQVYPLIKYKLMMHHRWNLFFLCTRTNIYVLPHKAVKHFLIYEQFCKSKIATMLLLPLLNIKYVGIYNGYYLVLHFRDN